MRLYDNPEYSGKFILSWWEEILSVYPPPTKWTTSIAAPDFISVDCQSGRRTILRLISTATSSSASLSSANSNEIVDLC